MGKNMAGITARFGMPGEYYQRWGETQSPRDNRTGDEIAADIITRAGLTVGDVTP